MKSLACTILCLPAVALADDAVLDASTAPKFGDALLERDDPFNAQTFYSLALFLDPQRADADRLQYRIALCYERGRRWDAATTAWLDLAGSESDLAPEATYRAGMSALGHERWQEAQLYWSEVAEEAPDSPWAERARFVSPIADLKSGHAEAASGGFQAFLVEHPGSPLAPRASAAIEVLDAHRWHRSPGLAAAFSTVLPGSGQLYAGHPGDAVMTFLATGSLSTLTFALLRQGIQDDRGWEVATGSVVGVFAATAWSANVVGAWSGTHRANRHHERTRADQALGALDSRDLMLDPADVTPPPLP